MKLWELEEQLQRLPDKHLEVCVNGKPVESVYCCAAYPPRTVEFVARQDPEGEIENEEDDDE